MPLVRMNRVAARPRAPVVDRRRQRGRPGIASRQQHSARLKACISGCSGPLTEATKRDTRVTDNLHTGHLPFAARRVDAQAVKDTREAVAEEVPIALSYNDVSH